MIFRVSPSVRRVCLLVAGGFLLWGLAACDKPKSEAAANDAPNAAPAPAASAADGHLAGLYIRQQMVSMFFGGRMTFNLQREFFYFFPDGHLLYAIPSEGNLKEHPTADDFAAFKDIDAKLRGTYAVKDGNITFTPEVGKPSTEPFSIPKAGDDSVLQIGVPSIVGSVKAMPFKDGQKLNGSYQYDGTVGQGTAVTVFNVNTLNFKADGTLGSDQLTGLDTVGRVQTPIGNSGVTTGKQTASAGTYHFNGYTLETTIDGKSAKATVFRWAGDDKEAEPGMICIAGRVYSHLQAKK